MFVCGPKGAISDPPQFRVWVAMWVQSASKKVSFCLIILARVGADTLSANPPVVLTRLSASPGSYREVSPLVFHPLPKKQQRTRASGTRPAIQLAVRRTYPWDSQKALNVIEKPACLRGEQIAGRRLTQPWTSRDRGWHDPCALKLEGPKSAFRQSGCSRRSICCGETLDRLT